MCCACSDVSLAERMKMLSESENGPPISNTSATHGEATFLALT